VPRRQAKARAAGHNRQRSASRPYANRRRQLRDRTAHNRGNDQLLAGEIPGGRPEADLPADPVHSDSKLCSSRGRKPVGREQVQPHRRDPTCRKLDRKAIIASRLRRTIDDAAIRGQQRQPRHSVQAAPPRPRIRKGKRLGLASDATPQIAQSNPELSSPADTTRPSQPTAAGAWFED
jgi:hypothetical protein